MHHQHILNNAFISDHLIFFLKVVFLLILSQHILAGNYREEMSAKQDDWSINTTMIRFCALPPYLEYCTTACCVIYCTKEGIDFNTTMKQNIF